LGVSHREQVDPRGHVYARPLQAMREYLDAMDAAPFVSPMPEERPPAGAAILAALAAHAAAHAERADGAHRMTVRRNRTPASSCADALLPRA
jgi:hypothetical protein